MKMKILYRMSVSFFLKYFIFSVLFFILILELLDIFSNLWRYINNSVSFIDIFKVALLYLPKCIAFSIPVSVLFSIAYLLGDFHANNELIAIFGSGISLCRFVFPFILAGLIMSLFSFFFEESIVIPTYREKKEFSYELLNSKKSYNNNDITVVNPQRDIIYQADYYNDSKQTLSGVIVLDRTQPGSCPVRLDAKSAEWDRERRSWVFHNVRIYKWDEIENLYSLSCMDEFRSPLYDQTPDSFRNIVRDVEEMKMKAAKEWIGIIKNSGFPYIEHLTEYYKRFSFAFTPFIVALISVSSAGKFKRNVLLMSLLMSIMTAGAYYILQMILVLFAKLGYIPPLVGAWGAFIIFMVLSIFMFRYANR